MIDFSDLLVSSFGKARAPNPLKHRIHSASFVVVSFWFLKFLLTSFISPYINGEGLGLRL